MLEQTGIFRDIGENSTLPLEKRIALQEIIDLNTERTRLDEE